MKLDFRRIWWTKVGNEYFYDQVEKAITSLGFKYELEQIEYELDNNDFYSLMEQLWAIQQRMA